MLKFSGYGEGLEPLNDLALLKAEFFLTGSRYFGNCRLDSDWDFFTNHSTDLPDILVRMGFRDIKLEYLTQEEAERQEIVHIFRKGRVDVQLVRCANTKRAVQEAIKNSGGILLGDTKAKKNLVWSLAYAAFNANKVGWLRPM